MATISGFAEANRGPLTTIYTPPASCLSHTTLVSHLTSVSSISSNKQFLTTKLFANHFSWGDSSCYPPSIATIDGTTRWGNGYYYSPGICPSGWSSACQQRTIVSVSGFTNVLDAATTGVLCCPSNWSCVAGTTTLAAHGCSIALTAGQTLSSVYLAPTPATDLVIPTNPALVSWAITSNTSALCDAIPVLWQNTDLKILALLSSTPTLSSSSGSSSATSSSTSTRETGTNSSTSTVVPASKASGLSTGAKAAIGVVIPLVIIAAVIGIFLLVRRHKKRSLASHQYELAGESGVKYEMGPAPEKPVVEADAGNVIMEMGAVDGFADKNSGVEKSDRDRLNDEAIHELPTEEIPRKN